MSELEFSRLARIEEKVDTLTEAISKLAVVEARLTDFIAANSRLSTRIAEVEKAQNILSTNVQVQQSTLNTLSKICWALGLGLASTFGTIVLKVIGLL